MLLRPEAPSDIAGIRSLLIEAFRDQPHSDGTEAQIVDRLRDAGALTVALVATGDLDAAPIGMVAFSPVTFDDGREGWYGLGPLAVRRTERRRGIGATLVETGLKQLQQLGAHGCVVAGEPAYYSRFGFIGQDGLETPGIPAPYFLASSFDGTVPTGLVRYHAAFYG